MDVISTPATCDEVFDRHLWQFYCIREITYRWDQWMSCTIRCNHGTYNGVSDGLLGAMGQSLSRAFEAFRAADVQHDRDDDDA